MKLSFSTLGCPNWTLERIVTNAKVYGFQGLEIRGIQGEYDLFKVPAFQSATVADTRLLIEDHELEIVVFGSSARFSSLEPAERAKNLEDAKKYARLAADFGTRYVRVFGGTLPKGADREECFDHVGQCLKKIAKFCGDLGVMPLLELHDAFMRGEDAAAVVKRAGHDNLGVVWDIRHSVSVGEPPETTLQLLRDRIRHVHIKDEDEQSYCLLGNGQIPIRETMSLLAEAGYDGYYSLEWEKGWNADLEEPEVVFPQYVEKMKEYASVLGG